MHYVGSVLTYAGLVRADSIMEVLFRLEQEYLEIATLWEYSTRLGGISQSRFHNGSIVLTFQLGREMFVYIIKVFAFKI